jgi:hypothetical protein
MIFTLLVWYSLISPPRILCRRIAAASDADGLGAVIPVRRAQAPVRLHNPAIAFELWLRG